MRTYPQAPVVGGTPREHFTLFRYQRGVLPRKRHAAHANAGQSRRSNLTGLQHRSQCSGCTLMVCWFVRSLSGGGVCSGVRIEQTRPNQLIVNQPTNQPTNQPVSSRLFLTQQHLPHIERSKPFMRREGDSSRWKLKFREPCVDVHHLHAIIGRRHGGEAPCNESNTTEPMNKTPATSSVST